LIKRALYAQNGVREYWIVDDDSRTVEVFALRGQVYDPQGFFRQSEAITSNVISGLSIAIADVFA